MTSQVEGITKEKYEWFGLIRLEFIERDDMRTAICHFCKKGIKDTNFYTLLEWGYCSNKCAKKALEEQKAKYLVNTGKPLTGTHNWIYHIVMVNSKKHSADKIPNYVRAK